MKRRRSTTSEGAGGLLAAILGAADRDRSPGAAELVACREGDDADYLKLLRERARRIVELRRFGRPLLSVAEFPAARTGARARDAQRMRRWRTARPIVLPRWASPIVERERRSIAELSRLLDRLRKPGSLGRFLEAKAIEVAAASKLDDPDRDLEKYFVPDPDGARLWVKSATLTSPGTNRSGRIRFSFGAEGGDDASADESAHARVSRLARRCLPFADSLARSRARMALLERWVGGPVLLTQHIAYWNAPEGGALLHHDAFHEPMRSRQRGVCYVQLGGATIWLALSTADLVRHTRAFVALLARGAAPWIVDEHLGGPRRFARLARRSRDADWLSSQLTSPGCGAFASLVNYSPEFLGVLIDAGHAWRLGAGDAILLANHGPRRTALHAVWCATERPGAAISMAIRRS